MELADTLKVGQPVVVFSLAAFGRHPLAGSVRECRADSLTVVLKKRIESDHERVPMSEGVLIWEHDTKKTDCSVVILGLSDGVVLTLKIKSEDRRDYLRVVAPLSLHYELVSGDVIQQTRDEIVAMPPAQGDMVIETDHMFHAEDMGTQMEERFEQMKHFLDHLDSKIDYLIAVVEGRTPERKPGHVVHLLDISGSGLEFVSEIALETGLFLDMRIEMCRFPMIIIRTLGRVVRCSPVRSNVPVQMQAEGFEIGIIFDTVHDVDRERVFRYISRLERQALRDRKERLTRSPGFLPR
jgi:hypothetical protein